MEKFRPKIYVAAQLTRGDMMVNTKRAVETGRELYENDMIPFVPHLSVIWQAIAPLAYEEWMDMDFEWVKVCDGLLRIPGESPGADREEALARELGKPVGYSVKEMREIFFPKVGGVIHLPPRRKK